MGKLMEKLKRPCPECGELQVPRRLSGKFLDEGNERVYLMCCRVCEHYWKDPTMRKKSRSVFTDDN